MNTKQIQDYIQETARATFGIEIEAHLDIPRDPSHGDLATNIAMQLAGQLQKNPREIATKLVQSLEIEKDSYGIASIEIAGPGFINIRLNTDRYGVVLHEILEQKEAFGTSTINAGKTYLIEHTSPNPTGDLHIGHLKNNVTGLALARLFEAIGTRVIKDMIDNNRGIAIARLLWGYLKYGRIDGDQTKIDVRYWTSHTNEWITPETNTESTQARLLSGYYTKASDDFKNSEDIQAEMQQMLRDWEAEEPMIWELWKQVMEWIWDGYETSLRRIGGWQFDTIWHEHEIYKAGRSHVERGLQEGVFRKLPDGAVLTDLKKQFNLTDTIVMRADGTTLYITQDLELTRLKKETFHPDEMFWVIGPEQDLQMKQAFACAAQLGFGNYEDFHHIAYGFVFVRNEAGKQVKMSKRLGNLVYVDDLVDNAKEKLKRYFSNETIPSHEIDSIAEKVAIGAIKYSLLKVNRLKDQTFDFDTILSFEGDSGPYIMYTYARCKSILEKSGVDTTELNSEQDIDLSQPEEIAVIKTLQQLPETVIKAAQQFETHLIPSLLFEIAQAFNTFYNKHSILQADTNAQRHGRLLLTAATAQVIVNALRLLNIEPVERM